MSATAEPLIGVLFGDKWLPAAPLLQLLALVMPFRLLSNVFSPLLWGVGAPRTSAMNYAIAAVLMPVAFLFGAQWGIFGIACAWLFMYPVVFVVTAWRTCQQVCLPVSAYLAALWRPLIAGIALYMAVLALRGGLSGGPGDWFYLGQLVIAGGAAWCLSIVVLDLASLKEIAQLARGGGD
ncbi:polysaccharide biosynthesis C-terminal domain-containing protein [Halioglobus sp.]|nr:polysaccharide biosynthesis C-terminal domain-containing protein [Halioglobus sp.]